MEFTDEALVILGIAQSKAAIIQSTAGSEHILLALSESDELAGVILRDKGVSFASAQNIISAKAKDFQADDSAKKAGFTAIIARSKEIARDQGVAKVGTEQILLALLDIECDGREVLKALEVDPEPLKKEISKGIKFNSSGMTLPSVKLPRRNFMVVSGVLAFLVLIVGLFSFSIHPQNHFEPISAPLKELVSICPPPERPTYSKYLELDGDSNALNWTKIEKELNFDLPEDFKKLYETYGSGVFSNQLWLLSLEPEKVIDRHKRIVGFQKSIPERYGENQIYPKMPGLFQCATVGGDGVDIFWLTSGKPDSWPILINQIKSDHSPVRFEMSLSEFIVRSFKGQIKSNELPEDYDKTEMSMFSPDFYQDEELKFVQNRWILSGHRIEKIIRYRFPGTDPRNKEDIELLKKTLFELQELAGQHHGKYQDVFDLVKAELGEEAYKSLMTK